MAEATTGLPADNPSTAARPNDSAAIEGAATMWQAARRSVGSVTNPGRVTLPVIPAERIASSSLVNSYSSPGTTSPAKTSWTVSRAVSIRRTASTRRVWPLFALIRASIPITGRPGSIPNLPHACSRGGRFAKRSTSTPSLTTVTRDDRPGQRRRS